MRDLLVIILILLWSAVGAAQEGHQNHQPALAGPKAVEENEHRHHPAHAQPMKMAGVLGIPFAREGSGTSWLPDETPMHAFHLLAGGWEFMLHGNLFVQYIDEGGSRGDSQLGSINWIMGMASRELGQGRLSLRAMLSAEPWTVGKCGYPDLLATGEFCNGEPLHDRQHPHDLFMELAGIYQQPISEQLGFEIYGGPAAEPALGPTAFPHRPSAFPSPLAPISHHWLDATHISFGVLTAGLFSRQWKIETSVFNGREPDEVRTNLDLAPMDSFSSRVQWLPNKHLSVQVSGGHLNEAEQGEGFGSPRIDVDRYTASAIYHLRLPNEGLWATTIAVGRNVEEGHGTNAVLVESSYDFSKRHIFSGRAEWVEKTAHDLVVPMVGNEDDLFTVAKVSAGYTYQLDSIYGLVPGIGAGVLVSVLPSDLEPTYGERMPIGFAVYLSIRPEAMNGAGEAVTPSESNAF